MGKEEKLLNKIGRDTGMNVPDGYFEEFSVKMMEKLPAYPEAPRPKVLSTWQRIKPYIYMAAMFAGIWCMMKMFHIASERVGGIDNPPADVVAALQTPEVYDYYTEISNSDLSDFELEESVSETYDSMEDFEADFDYDLSSEYASIKLDDNSKG